MSNVPYHHSFLFISWYQTKYTIPVPLPSIPSPTRNHHFIFCYRLRFCQCIVTSRHRGLTKCVVLNWRLLVMREQRFELKWRAVGCKPTLWKSNRNTPFYLGVYQATPTYIQVLLLGSNLQILPLWYISTSPIYMYIREIRRETVVYFL